jgi:hypothetical protein
MFYFVLIIITFLFDGIITLSKVRELVKNLERNDNIRCVLKTFN